MNNVRLRKKYIDEIVPVLKEKLQYKSLMQVPKIKKISINQGLGASVNDKKLIQHGIDELPPGIAADCLAEIVEPDNARDFELARGERIEGVEDEPGKRAHPDHGHEA